MQAFSLMLQNLTLRAQPGATALITDLTVSLGPGLQALVGRNGVGKSLLAQVLAGQRPPDGGTIQAIGTIGYLPQHIVQGEGETLADFLDIAATLAALRRLERGEGRPEDIPLIGENWTLAEDVTEALQAAALPTDIDRPLTRLSGGERTRLALFRLMRSAPDYLILDEPSNHLDLVNRQHLRDQLLAWPKGCLLISHDPLLLDHMTMIHELSPLGLKSYGGNYRAYLAQKQAERDAAETRLAEAQKDARKSARQHQANLEKQQQRQAQGRRLRQSGSQSKLLLDAQKGRSESTLNRLAKQQERQLAEGASHIKEARQHVDQTAVQGFLIPEPKRKTGRALGLSDVVLPHGNPVPISLTLEIGDHLAVMGPNGSGKSTFLQVILNDILPKRGRITVTERIGYLDQTGRQFDPALPALDLLKAAHPNLEESLLRTRLATIGLRRDKALQPFHSLSGGERMKVALIRLFAGQTAPDLLLLDEPDNHLDLNARQLLIDSLNRYQGAIVLVTHSPDLVEALGIDKKLAL